MQSHPMWVRGLKHDGISHGKTVVEVAPYVGAWIETVVFRRFHGFLSSHPMWVRGLKLGFDDCAVVLNRSHPMWVRGLKPF